MFPEKGFLLMVAEKWVSEDHHLLYQDCKDMVVAERVRLTKIPDLLLPNNRILSVILKA